jgi:hypothetical protein
MGECSSLGSFDCRSSSKPTLQESISGQKLEYSSASPDSIIKQRARQVLANLHKEGQPEKKVWKDVDILARYGKPAKTEPERMDMTNLESYFDLEGHPLIWLGEATDGESLDWLEKTYRETRTEKVKENILAAVAIHQNPALVVPILASVLESQETDELRKNSAFWALEVLIEIIKGK